MSASPFRNRLLNAFAVDDLDALRPSLEAIDLPVRTVLVEMDRPIDHVHFLEGGIASVVATSVDGEQIEVGHVGREGMTGTSLCLGVSHGSTRTFIQVAGQSHRMARDDFEAVAESRPQVRALVLRYLHVARVQVEHSALANARYSLRQRLARWLLMSHDRIDGDDLPLTHEFLSLMLGVRRAGVTGELHILEGLSVIKATRGNIRMLDRARMKEIAGGCYGYPEAVYDRLIDPAALDHSPFRMMV